MLIFIPILIRSMEIIKLLSSSVFNHGVIIVMFSCFFKLYLELRFELYLRLVLDFALGFLSSFKIILDFKLISIRFVNVFDFICFNLLSGFYVCVSF